MVVSLKPGNFMGLNGAAPGIIGSTDSGGDTILQLQRAAIEFSQLYQTQGKDDELDSARRKLAGKIMVAVTLGALSERKADELMSAMSKLMKERKQ
ncbi:MAG TPA: hypothetical protein VFH39_03580 [Candidatus Saccharimonadales bacterium]|nr:hypothetical protein [Candidatus Saccharimonadales bacterium]